MDTPSVNPASCLQVWCKYQSVVNLPYNTMDACEKLRVGQMVIDGMSAKDIAPQMGCSEATIYRVIADKDVKARINHCRALIAEQAYTEAANNVIQVIKDYKSPANGEDRASLQAKDHGFKASVKVLESMGLLASQSPSLFVQQIYNTQVNNMVSPLVDQALARSLEVQDVVSEDQG